VLRWLAVYVEYGLQTA